MNPLDMFETIEQGNDEPESVHAESLSGQLKRAALLVPREGATNQEIDLNRLNQSQIVENTQEEVNKSSQDVDSTNSGNF